MQNFKDQYNLNRWVLKKFTPLTVVMKGKISYIDQNHFLHQAVNMFFSAVKLGILTWGVFGIDSLLQPASSGQSMNCSFSHFRVGFTRERAGGCLLVENCINRLNIRFLHVGGNYKRPFLLIGQTKIKPCRHQFFRSFARQNKRCTVSWCVYWHYISSFLIK